MKENCYFYSCPYCKTEYENPGDLARCILRCEEKKKKEEAEAKQKKLEQEKEMRYKEIENAINKVNDLISEYTKDYGKFSFTNNEDYPLNYLWNKLFF